MVVFGTLKFVFERRLGEVAADSADSTGYVYQPNRLDPYCVGNGWYNIPYPWIMQIEFFNKT